MSNEITLYERFTNPLDAIDRLGEVFAKSGFVGADRQEQGKFLAVVCMAERKSPVDIIRNYDIVMGKLRKKAIAAFADFRAKGGKVTWVATGDDGKAAEADVAFEGQTLRVKFTMDDARKQGIVKAGSAWDKTPGNMLRARCLSNAIAMLCPEVFAGDDGENDQTPGPALDLGGPAPITQAVKDCPRATQPATEAMPEAKPAVRTTEPVNSVVGRGAIIDIEASVVPSPKAEPVLAPAAAPATTTATPAADKAPVASPVQQPKQETATAAGDLVLKVAELCAGKMLQAAKIFMGRGWTPKAELADEARAAAYLEQHMPGISEKRLQHVLNNAESFKAALG